jgi:hypothetical protein
MLLFVIPSFINAYIPVIDGSFAVNQLNDSIDSNASMKLYEGFKSNLLWIYLVIPIILFMPEIIRLGRRKN